MEFGPRMHIKEGEFSTLQEDERNLLFFIFHFLQDGEKKLLCCNISLLGGQNKNKANQTTNKNPTIHPRNAEDQKKIYQYKIF